MKEFQGPGSFVAWIMRCVHGPDKVLCLNSDILKLSPGLSFTYLDRTTFLRLSFKLILQKLKFWTFFSLLT